LAEPLNKESLTQTEKEYGFSYRQGIRELIYTMVTRIPDISFPLIKLSQYSATPTRQHFQAVQGIYNYLRNTVQGEIYFWVNTPQKDLPEGTTPTCPHPNNYMPHTREQQQPTYIRATVDSDYAGDTAHRQSVTGISVKTEGGSVYYKKDSKLQYHPALQKQGLLPVVKQRR